jgi:hypothetical protein
VYQETKKELCKAQISARGAREGVQGDNNGTQNINVTMGMGNWG